MLQFIIVQTVFLSDSRQSDTSSESQLFATALPLSLEHRNHRVSVESGKRRFFVKCPDGLLQEEQQEEFSLFTVKSQDRRLSSSPPKTSQASTSHRRFSIESGCVNMLGGNIESKKTGLMTTTIETCYIRHETSNESEIKHNTKPIKVNINQFSAGKQSEVDHVHSSDSQLPPLNVSPLNVYMPNSSDKSDLFVTSSMTTPRSTHLARYPLPFYRPHSVLLHNEPAVQRLTKLNS